ncbi:unnamed protein product [Alopecurus aequalis]
MANTLLNTSQHTSGATSQFKFEILNQITNNFSKDRVIGSGAYGVVYKGVMDNGQEIAVKKLIDMPLDHDNEKFFHDECINLLRVQHKNIVRLVGYCDETHRQCVEYEGKLVFADKNERALCFEYLQSGSLAKYVSNEPCTLAWDTCYKIIKGVCDGLNHLHNVCAMFHLDLKPANILLDNNMIPKIGDFGLSRHFSSTKTCTTATPLGTTGYTPPEYVNKQEISPKYDVFSLGVVIIHMMAGRTHYYDHVDTPSKIIELVCGHWEKRLHATMWSLASQEVKTCIEIALRCVKSDRQERPTISKIVDDLNRIDIAKFPFTHDSNKSIMRDQASHAILGPVLRAVLDPPYVTQKTEVEIEGHPRRKPHPRADGNIHTPVIMDTIGNLFQWARSTISSTWNGTHDKVLHDELFRLESGLQHLMDTLPAMNDLIDRAEFRSHKHRVADYLAKLKDTVYDAEDLLDEVRWYMLKVKVEGNGSQSPPMDFFSSVIQGSFAKLVNAIQDRLDNISIQLRNMVLHDVTTRFDKSIRPETSSFPNETELFGRDMELKQIIEWLCPKLQQENSDGKKLKDPHVLPIVGIGGVGKTTLAQHICSDSKVNSHFHLIIWIFVSDDFNVKRLTKETIESCGKQAIGENLNSLQKDLSEIVKDKRFLIILDDTWDDALKENGQRWKRFCAPLKSVIEGSVMLVTSRSQKVASRVGTRDPITLEGLENDVFWNFFKICVFESGSSNNNDPELERIGRSIVPKLKGSPLAAKTLGRILSMNLQAEYWTTILDSELWTLRQEETEILPALRLSYMYLPFHLKRCFSLCAVYPKDYRFEKGDLAEIWAAEGFVEPQGDIPVKDIGCEYFNDLLDRSFFQEVQGEYVIHDLLHDMVQKVSEFDCFIVKRRSDFKSIPHNIRHLSILSSRDIDYSNLLGLCRFTKLRTLLCYKPLVDKETTASLLASWCSEFRRLRVIVFTSIHELPASIGNLKHLRYLKIHSKIENFPTYFDELICLRRFESHGFRCDSMFGRFQGKRSSLEFHGYLGVSLISFDGLGSSSIPRITNLIIDGCENLSSLEHVIHPAYVPTLKKIMIKNCKRLVSVPAERFGDLRCLEELVVQECPKIYSQSLVAPSLKRLVLGKKDDWSMVQTCGNLAENIDCCSLTYLFFSCNYLTSIQLHKWNLPALMELHISGFENLTSIIRQSGQAIRATGGIRAFPSLTSLTIERCNVLLTIDDILREEYLPAIERIHIKSCHYLVSLPGETFGKFSSLKELEISDCRRLGCGRGFSLPSSLQILSLKNYGDISTWVPSCLQNLSSLVTLKINYCQLMTSIPGGLWSTNLTSLENLIIHHCTCIVSIGGEKAISGIKNVSIFSCPELEEIKQPMLRGSYVVSREWS